MKKIIVEIEASEWTKENSDSFHEWLDTELELRNMAFGDDANVVSVKFADNK